MHEPIARHWVEALRSGEYLQGTGKLRNVQIAEPCDPLDPDAEKTATPGTRFCCLGVLCDLYAKEYPEAQWLPDKDPEELACLFAPKFAPENENELGQLIWLPGLVQEWAGMQSDTGVPGTDAAKDALRAKFACGALASANDFSGATFPQLADFIEQHWDAL